MTQPSALQRLDEQFHKVYDRARVETVHREPVLVVLGDALFFFREGDRQEACTTSEPAQQLKAVAHVPVGVYLTMRRSLGRAALDDGARAELQRLLDRCVDRRDNSSALLVSDSIRSEVAAVLDRCVALLEAALEAGAVNEGGLDAFSAEQGPRLLRLAEEATRLQLATLDEVASSFLSGLSSGDRDAVRVVVAGAHQARVRSLPMQYFQKRLGEPPGVEERVLYAEAVTDAETARALVGTHLLDRDIAAAFFGDPRRLQRDVLGDIAAARLESWQP